MDALLGNFDRHGGNWGFIKEKNSYLPAPIFDNGSCLFPNLIDSDDMLEIMGNDKEVKRRVYDFPTSQILLNDKKSSYYQVINSLAYVACNKSLVKIYKKYDFESISKLIDDTIFISETHKKFYKFMIQKRFELIIKASYERLMT